MRGPRLKRSAESGGAMSSKDEGLAFLYDAQVRGHAGHRRPERTYQYGSVRVRLYMADARNTPTVRVSVWWA
jgi:hypothetical protein